MADLVAYADLFRHTPVSGRGRGLADNVPPGVGEDVPPGLQLTQAAGSVRPVVWNVPQPGGRTAARPVDEGPPRHKRAQRRARSEGGGHEQRHWCGDRHADRSPADRRPIHPPGVGPGARARHPGGDRHRAGLGGAAQHVHQLQRRPDRLQQGRVLPAAAGRRVHLVRRRCSPTAIWSRRSRARVASTCSCRASSPRWRARWPASASPSCSPTCSPPTPTSSRRITPFMLTGLGAAFSSHGIANAANHVGSKGAIAAISVGVMLVVGRALVLLAQARGADHHRVHRPPAAGVPGPGPAAGRSLAHRLRQRLRALQQPPERLPGRDLGRPSPRASCSAPRSAR